jgi:inorganic pyrophosphatase
MPHERLSPQRAEITDISDLSEFTRLAIEQFFERNKEVEESRSVRVIGWDGRAAAEAAILRSLAATES